MSALNWGAPLWLLGIPFCLVTMILGLVRRWRMGNTASYQWAGMKAVSVDGGRLKELARGLRPPGRLIFLWLAVVFLFGALARPQWGWIELPRFEQAREVIVALDLSRSMWADDVKPTRLDRARLLVDNLLDQLKGERVGLVLFAGTAFTQSPLSADYEVLREFLPKLTPEYLPQGGTNYANMLDVVLEAFGQEKASAADRYLIILSDGESLSNDWQPKMKELKNAGVKVIGLGVGTQAGAVIQEPGGGVVKDENGSVVISRLNASTLQALARGTAGEYRQADRWLDLAQLLKDTVEKGRKGDFSEKKDRKPMERYQIPLLISLCFFAVSLWREYPVRPQVSKERVGGANSQSRDLTSDSVFDPGKTVSGSPSLPSGSGLLLISIVLVEMMAMGLQGQQSATPPDARTQAQQRLLTTVTSLSGKRSLDAGDYQSLAEVTIETGKAAVAKDKPLPRGSIEDALQGVFEGEKEDPQAADWKTLRMELEKLLKESPENKKQNNPQQNQQDQNKKENQGKSRQKQGGGGKSGNPSQDSGKQDQEHQDDQKKNDSGSRERQSGNSNKSKEDKAKASKDQNSGAGDGEKGNQKDEKTEGKTPQPSTGKPAERNGKNQMGKLDKGQQEQDEKAKAKAENEVAKPKLREESGQSQKLKTVKGSSNAGAAMQSSDPKVNAAMKQLEVVKGRDVPAELFQRLQSDHPQPKKNGRDW